MTEPTAREFEVLNQSIRDLNQTLQNVQRNFAETYARKDVVEPRLTSLEGTRDWAQKLVIGFVMVALLSLVIVQKMG